MASAADLSPDAVQLLTALTNQSSADKDLRESAGKALSEAFTTDPRPFVVGMELLRSPNVDDSLKTMLITHFRRFFSVHAFTDGIDQAIIDILREQLPETVALVHPKLLKLFDSAWAALIVHSDTRPEWPNLQARIATLLSNDASILVGLRILTSQLRYSRGIANSPWFDNFVPALLPVLQKVAPLLMAATPEEAANFDPPAKEARVANAILKIVLIALSRDVHKVLISAEGDYKLLVAFLEILPPLLLRGGHKNLVGKGDSVRVGSGFGAALKENSEGSYIVSKVRQHACDVMEQIIVTGKTAASFGGFKEGRAKVLTDICHGVLAAPIFAVTMQMFQQPGGPKGMTKSLTSTLLSLMSAVVLAANSDVKAALADPAQVSFIASQVAFPYLIPTEESLQRLQHDPEVYAMDRVERKDVLEASGISQRLLESLCKKQDRLVLVLNFLSGHIATFVAARPQWAALPADKQKELTLNVAAALEGISALTGVMALCEVGPKKPSQKFKGKKARTPEFEAALATFRAYTGPRTMLAQVLPQLLDSLVSMLNAIDLPLLRIYALQCISFIVVELNTDSKLDDDAIEAVPADYVSPDFAIREFLSRCDAILRGVVACLEDTTDSAIAVQANAGQTMKCIIRKGYRPVTTALAPYATNFAQAYVKLFEQFDASEFAQALATLIRHFPDRLLDHSLELLRIMVNRFVGLARKVYEVDQRAENEAMDVQEMLNMGGDEEEETAQATTRTMMQIVHALSDYPILIPELESILLPLGLEVFGPECAPFYDSFYDIIGQTLCHAYHLQDHGINTASIDDRYYGVLDKALSSFDSFVHSFRKLMALIDNLASSDLVRFTIAPPATWTYTAGTPYVRSIELCVNEMYAMSGRSTAVSLIESFFHQMTRVPAGALAVPVPGVGQPAFALTFNVMLRCLSMLPLGILDPDAEISRTQASLHTTKDRCYTVIGGAFWADATAAIEVMLAMAAQPAVLGLAMDNEDEAAERPDNVEHPPMPVGPCTTVAGRFEPRTFFSYYAAWVTTHLGPEDDEFGYDKRAACIGLASLLEALAKRPELPAGMFGSEDEVGFIVQQVVRFALETYTLQKRDHEAGSGYDEDDDSDDSSVVEGDHSAAAAVADGMFPGLDDDDLEDAFDRDSDDEDMDNSFLTPLDDLNEAVYLKMVYDNVEALTRTAPTPPAVLIERLLKQHMGQHVEQLQAAVVFGNERIAEAQKDKAERREDMRAKCEALARKRAGTA